MDRSTFTAFVSETLAELVLKAEVKVGTPLPQRLAFRWLGREHQIVTGEIVKHIVDRVYEDETHIFPCVDLAVADLLNDDTLLIVGLVAGYASRPFGTNWTGRKGPFVFMLGDPLLARIEGKSCSWDPEEGAFGYSYLEWPARTA